LIRRVLLFVVTLENLGKKVPQAHGANPRNFIGPRFLKELGDSGFGAQLYGK